MRSFVSAITQKISTLTIALVLVFSSIAATLPLFLSQTANAAPHTTYQNIGFDGLTWGVDRQVPSGGYDQSGDSLTVHIEADAAHTNSFYQQEGFKANLPSNTTSVEARLYIDPAWETKSVYTALWAETTHQGTPLSGWPQFSWPRVVFTNEDGAPVIRAYNTFGGTLHGNVPVAYGSTATLELSVDVTTKDFVYYANGDEFYRYGNSVYPESSQLYYEPYIRTFDKIFVNTKNGGEAGNDYTVAWSNLRIGEFLADGPTLEFPLNNGYTTTNNFWFEWSDVDGAVKYEFQNSLTNDVNADGSLTTVHYSNNNISESKLHSTGAADGSVRYWQARAVFADNSKSAWSEVWKMTIDMTAPVAPVIQTPLDGQYFKTSPILNKWSVVTDASGIAKYQVEYIYDDGHTFSGGPYREVNGSTTQRNHGPSTSEQGGVTIRVRAVDNAGNLGAWSDPVHYTYDATAPTADLQFPVIGPSGTSFKVVFSENVNSDDATNPANYFLNNWPGAGGSGDLVGDATIAYDASARTATISFTNAGWYISPEQEWGVKNVRDLAGNVIAETREHSTPLAAPTDPGAPVLTTALNQTNASWSWAASTDIGGSGVAWYEYSLDGGSWVSLGADTTSLTTLGLAEGSHTLSVRSGDNAGLVSGIVSTTVTLDFTAPTVGVNSITTTDTTPTITGTVNDPTAVVRVTINGNTHPAVNNGNGTWTLANWPHTLSAAVTPYTVAVEARDGANNPGTASGTVMILAFLQQVASVNTFNADPTSSSSSSSSNSNSNQNQSTAVEDDATEGTVNETDGQTLAATTTTADTVTGSVDEGEAGSTFSWWWLLAVAAALFFIIAGWRKLRKSE